MMDFRLSKPKLTINEEGEANTELNNSIVKSSAKKQMRLRRIAAEEKQELFRNYAEKSQS